MNRPTSTPFQEIHPRVPPSECYPKVTFEKPHATDSTATLADLPGPGRALSQFYDFIGKKLEFVINLMAKRLEIKSGLSHTEEVKRLEQKLRDALAILEDPDESRRTKQKKLWRKVRCVIWPKSETELESAEKTLKKSFRNLTERLQSSPPETQIHIFKLLTEIKSKNPMLLEKLCQKFEVWPTVLTMHSYFEMIMQLVKTSCTGSNPDTSKSSAATAYTALSLWHSIYSCAFNLPELHNLLSTSRQALFCIEDNALNRIAKQVWEMLASTKSMSHPDKEGFYMFDVSKRMEEMLPYLLHQDLAFLTLRYLSNASLSRFLHMDVLASLCLKLGLLFESNILPSGSKCCRINHLRTTQACLLLVYDKYWIKRNLESRFDLNTAQDEDPLTLPQHRAITDTLPVEVHLLKRYIHDVDFALHRRISQYYKDRYYVPERARLTEKVLSQFPRDNAEGERRLTKERAKAVLAVLKSESPNNCWQHLDERFDKICKENIRVITGKSCDVKYTDPSPSMVLSLTRREVLIFSKLCHQIDQDGTPWAYGQSWLPSRRAERG